MLVTFREHAAPDLCIFHTGVIMRIARGGKMIRGACGEVSGLFTAPYEYRTALW